ncbi:hypothetical protein, partial [Corynebacterium variabile]|uniref:hypothetical protein n=1 Tax=Corynebacterium variabile TaxID=1727 RepID=UPI003FD2AB60
MSPGSGAWTTTDTVQLLALPTETGALPRTRSTAQNTSSDVAGSAIATRGRQESPLSTPNSATASRNAS